MKTAKRVLSVFMATLIVLSCWIWIAPEKSVANAAGTTKDHYLFAYFTGTSKEGQTIHLAVSEDGYNYTALRNNEPVIIPSKGVGNVRDPYIWYNEQDGYYYILATDLDFTDGGGDYSNNSQSFIIWRSKDLVNWYDETFIDVSKMAHLIGDTRNMSAVWAPQVLWDGSAYVVYFTLACNATSWFDIVYLKTTDLMDPNAYYEFDYILGNGTGNGTDNGYGVIDADIIHNPGDGKYYLFYKTECNGHEMGSTATGTSLKTIHYYVGDTPTGPFRNPGDTKWANAGFSIFPNYNVSLEGCNSFFDNDGNLIMYVDEFEHKNAAGEAEAYFHIAKSNGYDFKSWSYPDVSQHNINSLSPRHGSVVKITEAEYTRLLNNSYNISSSSYPMTETLEDHLVARYFTTDDVLWNAVLGQPNLKSSTGITMKQDGETNEWYADFDSTNGGWAEGEFAKLFLNGLNYDDGFTITFKAMLQPNEAANNENNDRIYEIADAFGSRTGTEHYTHFSPGGGGNGSYLGNYNGPVDSGNDWLNDKDGANRDDKCFHEYIISYATGNVMVYVDGELVISRNRFTGVKLDDSWYTALGSNATMRIGKSGWEEDPLFKGKIQNLCIYDCSMSYYDAKSVDDEFALEEGWLGAKEYTGITSAVPSFSYSSTSDMEQFRGTEFSNILYTSGPNGEPYRGEITSDNSAAKYDNGSDLHYGMFYAKTTVLLLDGINPATMPLMFGEECDNERDKWVYSVYPTDEYGSKNDNTEFFITHEWLGWTRSPEYHNHITGHQDPSLGYRSDHTSYSSKITQDKNHTAYWSSSLQVDENNINMGGAYIKKYNLPWYVVGGKSSSYSPVTTAGDSHCGSMLSDHDIYVIDFRPILELRNSITKEMYDSVVNNTELCYELRAKYASAVKDIRTMNPADFGITGKGALTASKAFAKAIGEAVGTYNGVMAEIEREKAAGTYGHQPTEFEAREATCAQNGLTSGSYCVICGEILEEQQVIAPLAHTFGDIFEINGIKHRKCSGCGIELEYQPSEVRYENLFSLNRWMDSLSYNNGSGISGGTLSANAANGTITITNPNAGEVFTSASGTTRIWNCFCIPVSGGRTYVAEFTTSGVQAEMFVFKYDKDGNVTGGYGDTSFIGTNGTFSREFTTESTTAYIELRFDCNVQGTTTFSQIGVYEKENFDRFGASTADARLGYYPGDDKDLCYPNPADGYTFDGWYTANGMRVDNVYQLSNPSVVVYGKWIPAGLNVVYDSLFSFSSWAKSSCNQLWYGDGANGERLVSKEGIVADAEKGTITITNDADPNYFARTNYWVDTQNVHKMTIEQNTDYIIEYTATSSDGAKPSICAYITGGSAQYPESGGITRYGLGTYYFRIQSGNNTALTLRFDNIQNDSTVTFSNIAVYKAEAADHPEYFLDHAQNIENRQYFRYYEQSGMGIGDVFEYTPVREGYTFVTWKADTAGVIDTGDFNMKDFDDTFQVIQNWHLFSEWEENSYTIKYNANSGTGTVADQTVKYTDFVTLASGGFTKEGFSLAGWSTVPDATVANYKLGDSGISRLSGEANGTVTLYAVWVKEYMNVTFDNLIDFNAWNKTTASNATFSDITETGFTLTSTATQIKDGKEVATGEGTTTSPFFAVTAGKNYKIDIDITDISGNGWDVYIFFCDTNGKWVDFADGPTNRYSSGTTWGSIFTAPNNETVVKAQIRLDANKASSSVKFENIRVYEYDGISPIEVTPSNSMISAGSKFGTLPTPTKEGFTFLGWYYGDTKITADSIVPTESDKLVPLTSKWQLADTALGDDTAVIDFGTALEVETNSNDTVFNKAKEVYGATASIVGVSTDGGTASSTVNGTYGTFKVENNKVVYTPTSVVNGVETVYYHAQLNAGDKTVVKSKITVAPASNVLYEENLFTVNNALSGTDWTKEAAASGNTNTEDAIYGYGVGYDKVEKYSNGSALKATVTSTGKTSKITSFDFKGKGFDLISSCGPETGVLVVTLKNNDTNKMVKSYIVDTYYGDTNYGIDNTHTLYQVPVISDTVEDYGSYKIQVVASYLPSVSGALNAETMETQSLDGVTLNKASASKNEALRNALKDIGMEAALDAETVEIVWFDDDSVLNGGKGANAPAEDALQTASLEQLTNIVDSVRVYHPIENGNSYYSEAEQNAVYYNVMDNLLSQNAITGNGNFAYVSGNDKEAISIDTYDSIGSKDELYLSKGTNAVTFKIKNLNNRNVYISLRAASGASVAAAIGGTNINITSNTEMYYDITPYVNADGTVTIQNMTDNTLLAVGSLRITGETMATAALSTEVDLEVARSMMMAAAKNNENDVPDTQPEIPPTDDNKSECWLVRFFNWIVDMLTKLINVVKGFFG